ncbi:HAD family phosphatase [Mycoplasma sp. Pen4]|uniref:HAD family hydrolase n=1 Tax=Mycoplasma sp. Pen4 TaxID=640330 RepID=UPI0016548F9D|nr:HAD family hydrolase [Mycoplasma sp. Pen4]QNM93661.1 HAD family phosphatase [Mycoplasma sp. Pen4]
MKRLFAFDLDGTLLRKDNTINPETKKVLKHSREQGHYNVIATGRGLKKVLPLIENGELSEIDYIVCSNGALYYDVKNQTTHVVKTLLNKVFWILKDVALEHDLILTVDTIDFNGSYLPNNKFPAWMTEQQIMDMNIFNVVDLDTLEHVVLNHDSVITQIALRNPLETAKAITDEIREKTKDLPCEVYLTNSVYTDVNPEGISKYVGIVELLKSLGLTTQNLVTFGDSGNDVEMIEKAHIGVAVGNATQEAKAVADYVIGDHETATIGEKMMEIITQK